MDRGLSWVLIVRRGVFFRLFLAIPLFSTFLVGIESIVTGVLKISLTTWFYDRISLFFSYYAFLLDTRCFRRASWMEIWRAGSRSLVGFLCELIAVFCSWHAGCISYGDG